mgnify:CR=1 FL=1
MGMNIQKSAGVKADTFILKRNNMDRWIRMDVAMLIILAICTRLVAGIMNVEKMDAYTGSGEGFCKAVSESHGVDMVKDCFELGTQKVLDVKKTAKSVCKVCDDKENDAGCNKTDGNRRNNSGSKRCSGSKRRESCMGKYGLRENRDHNAGNSYG